MLNWFMVLFRSTISFCDQSLSCVLLFVTAWMVARQAPLSMEFFRQEYWSGLPFPPLGDLPVSGTEPMSLMSPALVGGFFSTGTPGKPCNVNQP